MTISVQSPVDALTAPGAAEDYMDSVRSSCGIVAGSIDGFINYVSGFSPLEEWVFKPLAGDWKALDQGVEAWRNAGKSAEIMKNNINVISGQLGEGWQGQGRTEFDGFQSRLTSALEPLPAAAGKMAEMTAAISDTAKAVADLIAAVINELVSFAIEMLASLAVPVAGEIAMPVWIAKLAAKVGRWSTKISNAILKFGELVKKLMVITNKIREVISTVTQITKQLEKAMGVVGKVVEAGGALAEYAELGWNVLKNYEQASTGTNVDLGLR